MIFNSRSVALFVSTLIGFITSFFLSLNSKASFSIITLAFIVSFGISFFVVFYVLEFLVFRELRKIYATFNRFRGDKVTFDSRYDIPLTKFSQELVTFANKKEGEIEKLKKLEVFRREFLADISHELKTPIFSAQGFIHTLLDGAIDDEVYRDKFLTKAAKSLDYLDSLVQDLMIISQLETGEVKMEMHHVDLRRIVKEVIEQLEERAANRGTKISTDFKKDEKYIVYADDYRIAQVFKNLIDNAIKYGNDNGHIKVQVKILKEQIAITVTDDGPGIDPSHHDRIFQRFYRVEKSRSKEMGGTGLGLSIVKHIIESHGSRIALLSKAGEGTTFQFKLLKGNENEVD